MELVTIYYDGLCPLCKVEIAHLRGRTDPAFVSFIDIAADDFDPAAHGIDLERAHRILHVKVGSEMRTGVEAVLTMWSLTSLTRWLSRLCRVPGFYRMACVGYWFFARVRPYLQRRRRDCSTGACRIS